MIAYASQTSGENRDRLAAAGWRQFVSPDTWEKNGDPTAAYALDNGAWGAFKNGRPWDWWRFWRCAAVLGWLADFVVVPDVVGNARATLELARVWIRRLAGTTRYLAAQDGMTWEDVAPFARDIAGVFLGGSTGWKLGTMSYWGKVCRANGKRLHVGRVNTGRRIKLCQDAGADSFDGSNASRYARVKLRGLDNVVRQTTLWKAIP